MASENASMAGKVALITGGNGGMGKATAEALAKKGATVVIIARSAERGEAARKEIIQSSGNSNVELIVADLSSMAQVRRAADEFKKRHDRLHVLVNNAAVFLPSKEMTSEGFEKTFATNYLSHFLLTNLLLDVLKASAPSRIVNVASQTGPTAFPFDDVDISKRKYSVFGAVGPTKLAMVMMAAELGRRLEGTGVTANSLHPGLVKSNLLDDMGWFMKTFFTLMSTSTEKGAQTAIYLASSPDVEKVSGKFFAKSKEATPSKHATNPADQKRLWDMSAKMVGLA